MNEKIIYAALGLGVLYFATREKSPGFVLNPVDTVPDEIPPPLPGSGTTGPGISRGEGLSLGWAPMLPVRPSFDARRWEDSEPTPGFFYQVRRKDSIEGIASRALASLATEAAEIAGTPKAEREEWVNQCSKSHALIQQACDSISTGWNDELYGHDRVRFTAPHGRGIDLEAKHECIRDALIAGRTPRRNIRADGTPIKSGARNRPYLWIPRWDARRFLNPKQNDAVRSEDDPYGSGVTGHWPPPAVTERGTIRG